MPFSRQVLFHFSRNFRRQTRPFLPQISIVGRCRVPQRDDHLGSVGHINFEMAVADQVSIDVENEEVILINNAACSISLRWLGGSSRRWPGRPRDAWVRADDHAAR